MSLDKPYLDVPGTTLFDMDQARVGYHLNQFCMSLMKAENRERFKADERVYLDEWPMTEEQKLAVLTRDMNRMIAAGGNIYFLAKIGATDGKSFQQMAGSMTGKTEEEYRNMMIAGGRSINGNRYIGEDGDSQKHRQPQGSGSGTLYTKRTRLWQKFQLLFTHHTSPPLVRRLTWARRPSDIGSRYSRATNIQNSGCRPTNLTSFFWFTTTTLRRSVWR